MALSQLGTVHDTVLGHLMIVPPWASDPKGLKNDSKMVFWIWKLSSHFWPSQVTLLGVRKSLLSHILVNFRFGGLELV